MGVSKSLLVLGALVEALVLEESAVSGESELPAEVIFQLFFLYNGPFGLNGHKLSGWLSLGWILVGHLVHFP